jgi:hypothetical protein
VGPAQVDGIAAAWAEAQLAANPTFIGRAIGVRVVLVPEGGQWFAELLPIRTRRRAFGSGVVAENPSAPCGRLDGYG